MSKLRSLSLVLAGIVLGVGISHSSQIEAAATKLLGSKVTSTMNVKFNKKTIGQAAVINGVSYLPVRTVANELNLGVGVSGQDVNLTSSEIVVGDPEDAKIKSEQMRMKAEKINKLTPEIRELKIKIKNLQEIVAAAQPEQTLLIRQKIERAEKYVDTQPEVKDELDSYKAQLKKINDDAVAAQKQIDELTPQLTALEAQLADLQK